MRRSEVLHECRCAKTIDQIEHAFAVRAHWLQAHPNDEEVFDYGEMLATMKDGIETTSEGLPQAEGTPLSVG